MGKIVLELDSVEAHLVLGSLGIAQLTASAQAAKLKGEDGEYASIRADVFSRVSTRIVDQLIPEDPRLVILREEVELGMV